MTNNKQPIGAVIITAMILLMVGFSVDRISQVYYDSRSISLMMDCGVSGIQEQRLVSLELNSNGTVNGKDIRDAVVDGVVKATIPKDIHCTVAGQMPVKMAESIMEGLYEKQ